MSAALNTEHWSQADLQEVTGTWTLAPAQQRKLTSFFLLRSSKSRLVDCCVLSRGGLALHYNDELYLVRGCGFKQRLVELEGVEEAKLLLSLRLFEPGAVGVCLVKRVASYSEHSKLNFASL